MPRPDVAQVLAPFLDRLRAPRRAFICAYVAAGLAFTVAFGLAVVYAFHGIHVQSGSDTTKAVADIVGGVVALLFGVAVLTGRVRGQQAEGAPVAGVKK